MPTALEPTTHFLNVDIDVLSRSRLEPLVEALKPRIFVHYVGPEGQIQGAHFSLDRSHGKTADILVRQLAQLIGALSGTPLRLWNSARTRDFNIGIQSGLSPICHELGLEPRTIALVSALNGRIVFTTYGSQRPPSRIAAKAPPAEEEAPPNPSLQRTRYARR